MRYPILAILYCGAWCADFVLVTWLRLLVLAPLTRQRRVIDRYFLDVAINISSSLGWDIEHAMKIAKVLAHLLPKPSCIVYLRVPAETAYSRKKDIPHIEYLNEREAFYRAVSEKIGAIVVDGTLPVEHVVEVILKSCWPNLQPSHQVH
ncbi:MAG: hypothetical protein JXA73_08495 [Acidobacteria bacterium]|nr:hypothetical protein [Acidobacteriota bacterium]